jgi:hypothetical protein
MSFGKETINKKIYIYIVMTFFYLLVTIFTRVILSWA